MGGVRCRRCCASGFELGAAPIEGLRHGSYMAKEAMRVNIHPKDNFHTTVAAPVREESASALVPSDKSGQPQGRGAARDEMRQVRPCSPSPSEGVVRAHELTHCPCAEHQVEGGEQSETIRVSSESDEQMCPWATPPCGEMERYVSRAASARRDSDNHWS